MSADPIRILTVCTGNICRSPAAERLLAAGLGDAAQVTSAGTGALPGYPMDAAMVPLVQAAGASVDGFAARQLTPAMVKSADLILALTTAHRSQAVRLAPVAVRRSFTLLELARIVGSPAFPALTTDSVSDRLREMVQQAAPRRMLGADGVVDDDVPDPFRRGPEVFMSSFVMIRDAVDVIVDAVH